jgi:hypothetical protein
MQSAKHSWVLGGGLTTLIQLLGSFSVNCGDEMNVMQKLDVITWYRNTGTVSILLV